MILTTLFKNVLDVGPYIFNQPKFHWGYVIPQWLFDFCDMARISSSQYLLNNICIPLMSNENIQSNYMFRCYRNHLNICSFNMGLYHTIQVCPSNGFGPLYNRTLALNCACGHSKFESWTWDMKVEEVIMKMLSFLNITHPPLSLSLTYCQLKMVFEFYAQSSISSRHMHFWVSILDHKKPCHIPLMYRHPIRINSNILPTYHILLMFVTNTHQNIQMLEWRLD